jgi:hypothetical protein
MISAKIFCCASLVSMVILGIASKTLCADENQLPSFGRDTVLVWKTQNLDYRSDFVMRIAEFLPDRFLEWEDGQTQGTLFMASRDIQEAQGYSSSNLFKSGIDARTQNVTTMWLSQKIFRDLKAKKKIKINLDGVQGSVTFAGTDQITLEVNKSKVALPVIKVKDDRGSERWFLDQEDNPLMVRHLIRQYDQSLVSITTDRPNTLRFIKGNKLKHN